MIRRFLADAWSQLWKGEPLDVFVEPVDPPQKALDAVTQEHARHQAEAAEPAAEEFGSELDEADDLIESVYAMSESGVLDRLAALSRQMSPWDAASRLFGGVRGASVNKAVRR